MPLKLKKQSKIAFSLFAIVLGMLLTISFFGGDYTYSASNVSNAPVSVYESINVRLNSSVNDKVSDYDIKNCTYVNHTDGDKMKFCIADFKGKTTGFYDSSAELLVVQNFENSLLVHELFHASSLHAIKKGITDFSTHEAQEMTAYDAEFLYEQIIAYKGDLITMETSKKLSLMYGN